MELNAPYEAQGEAVLLPAEGCDKCNNLGFKGRTGLYELLIMNDNCGTWSAAVPRPTRFGTTSANKGRPACGDCGIEALLKGVTTLDEVVRETVLDD